MSEAAIPATIRTEIMARVERMLTAADTAGNPAVGTMLVDREWIMGALNTVAEIAGVRTGAQRGFVFDLAAGMVRAPESTPLALPANRAKRRVKA